MAERRMFAKTIIDSDAFLDMPLSAQALYFHLNMRADDEGFVNNPKKIQRMIGASDDDLRLLKIKAFIIPFENGIVVIKHWRINNYIQSDRFHPTVYQDEKKLLELKPNNTYTVKGATECIQDVYIVDTEVRLNKDNLDKDIKERDKEKEKSKKFVPPTLEEIRAYCLERNNRVDPKAFFDYFEAGHWIDSKGQPVKNWKQKIITWENHNNGNTYKPETESKPKYRLSDL